MVSKRKLVLGLAAGTLMGAGYYLSRRDAPGKWSVKNVIGALVSEAEVTIERGVAYGAHQRHRLDIYRPLETDSSSPIVLFLYGGGWKSGDRETYRFVGTALASRSITTVIPDYRLYPEVVFPSFVQDAALAYAWTWRNLAAAGGKARRIILFGHSAGAHSAALLAYDRRYLDGAVPDPAAPAGFIGLAGPYAFDPTTWPATKSIFAGVADADQARPVSFANGEAPPTLVMHGLDDDTVRLWNTRSLAEALAKAGVEVRALEFPDIGHFGLVLAMARPLRWRAPVLSEAIAFIRKTVR